MSGEGEGEGRGRGKGKGKVHILMFPYPAQGHILALLDLTHHLALAGLTITILITPKNLPILNPLLSSHPPNTIQTLLLPFPPHPNIPAHVENLRHLSNAGNYPVINALSKLQPQIIHWFSTHPNPPLALISDFFLGWTHHLAAHLAIPRIAFYGVSAFLANVLHHCWRNPDLLNATSLVHFPHLPGTPSFERDHLPSVFLRYRESDPESDLVRESFLSNHAAWGSVLNTFRAFEGPHLGRFPRAFAVGPLGSERAEAQPERGSEILEWLDAVEEESSVLYVCFGSQKLLKKEQMEALALGLERSQTRFLWVVKTPSTEDQLEKGYGLLPEGFEGRVAGRGLVVKGWAPQVAILSHRAVGGFLSHCGWNSVMEGMLSGVAIVGWPMEADQFVNASLVVEERGVGVRVCSGADSVPDPDHLAGTVAEVMTAHSPQKIKANLMREEAIRAVSQGGDSSLDLDHLVKALLQLAR
ncbi:hypothetical protein Fmac_003091 [Flemingia macrophylla]|uniref:Uncharacterized protein n=1 Tax=Flemingia macrophylla TaxID=520843 RepID=A0ABD1NLS8_9FABA